MKNFLTVVVLLVLNVLFAGASGPASFAPGVSAQIQGRGWLRCYVPLIRDPRATREINLIISDHAYSFVS
jgi:hypothetical protein